jgi:type II secretory pathway pseudopilin PulG
MSLRAPKSVDRRAFTLLEMLITLGAMAFLLAALWSLFGTYAKLFDAGRLKAGATQLITGLVQQMTDDLRGAVCDTALPPPGTTGSVRRFALFGDAHTLQIDISQTVWPRATIATFATGGGSYDTDETQTPQAQELRTVRYWFVDPTLAEQSDGTLRGGLTRREYPFDAPYDASLDPLQASAEAPPEVSDETTLDEEAPPPELAILGQLPVNYDDDHVTWVPEVLRVEFRYFDGIEWTSTWSTLTRKTLPLAVEILMDFQAVDELPKPTDENGVPIEEPLDPATDDLSMVDETAPPPPGVISRRVVVYLPQSRLRANVSLAGDGTGDPTVVDPWAAADPTAQLLDDMYDEEEQMMNEPLFTPGASDAGTDDRQRFRFARRAQAAVSGGTASQRTAPDQWLRLGP